MTVLRAMSLIALLGTSLWAQTAPSRDVIVIEGTVRDASGHPVENASVSLEEKDQPKPSETMTNKDGTFLFNPARPGIFRITAKKAGFKDAVIESLALAPGEKKRVNLVLEAPGSSTMEFEDKPSFTVAGITDYTAAGGHGADTNLRTSEMLARETAGLNGTQLSTTVDTGKEEKLRADWQHDPNSFDTNRELGRLYLSSGRASDAIPLLEAAEQIHSEDFANNYDLAAAYKDADNLPKARKLVVRMMIGANSSSLHRLLGDIEEKSGNPLVAEREYETATRLEPSEQNYFAWGTELLLHRAVLPAVEVFTKGATAFPRSERMLAGLGAALHASGRYEESAERLCAASDLKPNDDLPYLFLGRMQKAAPSPLPCAEEKLARFAHLKPDDPLANYFYAMALFKRDKSNDQIEPLLKKAVVADPKCADAYVELGELYSSRGDTRGSIAAYESAVAANPKLGEAHYRLGQAYKRTGDDAGAQRELQAYEAAEKTQAADIERQRHDLQQFLVVLKDTSH